MHTNLNIISPKRVPNSTTNWEQFFPYYAGYPEAFASKILESSGLSEGAVVFDPWNGSGTTTYAAAKLGFSAIGFDLNPAMVVIGRARLLSPNEADSLLPLCKKIIRSARSVRTAGDFKDPLSSWFGPITTSVIRSLEESIASHLVGSKTFSEKGARLKDLSSLAATFYVALFSVCRGAATKFRSTNPTWIRHAKKNERRISVAREILESRFTVAIEMMATALRLKAALIGQSKISLVDSTAQHLEANTVDMVLTSPPYCTRIDYTAATRIELAILEPILGCDIATLRRTMMGSIRVPISKIAPDEKWGATCRSFLDELYNHTSKASVSYYHKTHLDYFDKLSRSMQSISFGLKKGGKAVVVVQDSYYKDLHNDLAQTTIEMAQHRSLVLRQRADFRSLRSMSGLNGNSRAYDRPQGATETVLCFEKA